MSFAWSEVGLEPDEYGKYASQIGASHRELGAFDRECLAVVCGAFSMHTVIALLSMGVSLSDWGYNDEYVIRKVSIWQSRPLLISLLNPIWLVGFPLSVLFALGTWRRLRRAVAEIGSSSSGGAQGQNAA
jgi:hypothetical protein